MTDEAISAIRDLTTQPDAPEGAGLRIARDPEEDALRLSVTSAPIDGDTVVEAAGARVFLDAGAAEVLDDAALDAQTDGSGGVQFAVEARPE